jgi:hypothetical protein
LCEKAHHAIFSEIFKDHMDFHPDRAEGSHSLSTSSVIWEQTDDQGSSTCKGHARTKTATTVDKMQCFSSSFTLQALWRRSAHIPNLRSLPPRLERAEDTWEKEASRGQRGWKSGEGALRELRRRSACRSLCSVAHPQIRAGGWEKCFYSGSSTGRKGPDGLDFWIGFLTSFTENHKDQKNWSVLV